MRAAAGSLAGRALRRDQISAADEQRFQRLVEVTDGCWHWRLADMGEYGAFRLRESKISVSAHKFAAVLAHGDAPAGAVIMHLCDTPSCVRPDHLKIGTQQENMDDCKAKGRHRHGPKRPAVA